MERRTSIFSSSDIASTSVSLDCDTATVTYRRHRNEKDAETEKRIQTYRRGRRKVVRLVLNRSALDSRRHAYNET
jgi:hypothetical protein